MGNPKLLLLSLPEFLYLLTICDCSEKFRLKFLLYPNYSKAFKCSILQLSKHFKAINNYMHSPGIALLIIMERKDLHCILDQEKLEGKNHGTLQVLQYVLFTIHQF